MSWERFFDNIQLFLYSHNISIEQSQIKIFWPLNLYFKLENKKKWFKILSQLFL